MSFKSFRGPMLFYEERLGSNLEKKYIYDYCDVVIDDVITHQTWEKMMLNKPLLILAFGLKSPMSDFTISLIIV